MLFGLGEGLGYMIWESSQLPYPFLGGRSKPGEIATKVASNLGLALDVRETTSPAKAWRTVTDHLDAGTPVGLQLDSYLLEYFSEPFHFAGHQVAIVGYDDTWAYLVDTVQQGGEVTTSLTSLAAARAAKGPMAAKHLSYVIEQEPTRTKVPPAALSAIRATARTYLAAPMSSFGAPGIAKTGARILPWYDRANDPGPLFGHLATMMDRAGTGGAIFRNLYRDFLGEVAALTSNNAVVEAHSDFITIASLWSHVIDAFEATSVDRNRSHIEHASSILRELAVREDAAMRGLADA